MGIATGSLVALMFRVSDVFLWGFISVLTARTLTVEDRGLYSTMIVASSAVSAIVTLGSASGYFVSNRKRDAAEVGANALTVILPIAAVLMLFGLLVLALATGSDGQVAAFAMLSIPPAIIRNTSLGVILGQNSILKYNIGGDVAVVLAMICLGIWLGVLGHRTAEGAMQAWCLAQYLSLIPFVFWCRSWWSWLMRHRPDPSLMRAMGLFSAITGLGGIVGILNLRVDQLLVIRLDGKEGAGIYSSAIGVAEGLWLFSSAITVASFARVGRGDPSEAARLTAAGIRHTVLVVICGGLSAALLGPYLIEFLFGHAYSGAGQPLRILCLGTAFFAPQGLVNLYYVNHAGIPRFPLFIGILSLVSSVVGGFLLIPPFGTSGAASATTISYGIATAVSVTMFLRRTGQPLSAVWRVRASDIRAYINLALHVLDQTMQQARRIWRAVVPA